MRARTPGTLSLASQGCPVCDGDCVGFPDVDHAESYPFLPGGHPMPDWIPAPHRIDGDGVVLYGIGEPVPIEEARRLGLLEEEAPAAVEPGPEAPKRGGKRARKAAEDRAHKIDEDR